MGRFSLKSDENRWRQRGGSFDVVRVFTMVWQTRQPYGYRVS
jgi:hypothetical protein